MSTEVRVPTLGESVTEATIATWFKKIGDPVELDEMLCELETDKVTVEVPSPIAGVITEIVVAEGSTVSVEALLAKISEGAVAQITKASEQLSNRAKQEPNSSKSETIDIEDAPSAKKIMAEKGITRSDVIPTGRDGRIMKADVLKDPTGGAPEITPINTPSPVPVSDASREERVKMTRLRQTIARRLKDSQNTAAMLTTYNEVDMTEVIALRDQYKELFLKKHSVKLGFMSFFTIACCHALKEVPEVNAEVDGTDIIYKNFVHIGIAAGTPTGLVVPVIRDADAMSFAQIEKEIAEKGPEQGMES